MASAIRSIYLVRNKILLKAHLNLFRTFVLPHLDFSAIHFCLQSAIKVCHPTQLTE